MADRKTEFYWASIAGADPEPVEKTEISGRPVVYTGGCADPFFLDEPNCPVRLGRVRRANWPFSGLFLYFPKGKPPEMLERPGLADAEIATNISIAFDRSVGSPKSHGWRGPR